jgi:hypothetical protein
MRFSCRTADVSEAEKNSRLTEFVCQMMSSGIGLFKIWGPFFFGGSARLVTSHMPVDSPDYNVRHKQNSGTNSTTPPEDN